jgi:hypothetical protein
LTAAVGSASVVVSLVLGQDRPQVSFAEDEHPVGDLGPDGQHEPFRESVRARAPGRDLHGVSGVYIWARIDDRRQRSLVTGSPRRPSGSRRQPRPYACRTPSAGADGGQTSLPWPPSRSVFDSVGTAGDEFSLPIPRSPPAQLVSPRIAPRSSSYGLRFMLAWWRVGGGWRRVRR